MEPQNHHNIIKRTTHYLQTQYIHCTYDTKEPPNHRGLEDLALNYGTAEPQHNISHRTAHDTETQYLHGTYHTYSTEAQLNQSYCWTRAPSPRLWNSRSTTLEKETLHRDAIQKHKATE